MGSAGAERLRAAKYELTGLARSDAAASCLSAAGVQPIRGDFTDSDSIGAAARSGGDPHGRYPARYRVWPWWWYSCRVRGVSQKEGGARFVEMGRSLAIRARSMTSPICISRLWSGPPAGTLLLGVHGPSYRVRDVAAAASRGAGAGGRTTAWPLEQARKTLGAYADALVLDQQATGKRAQELLRWRPSRPNILADIEHGSYLKKG